MSRKHLVFASAAVALGLLAGIYAVEIVFRTVLLRPVVPEDDADFRRIVAAHWTRPATEEKTTGTFRILGLADSFGVAGGTNNYHAVLERLLRERGHDVEVVNFSVPAYSIADELALLQRFGARYRPDLVLHGFFVGNDLALAANEVRRYRSIDIDVVDGSWWPHRFLSKQWFDRWRRARAETKRRDAESAEAGFSHDEFLRIERVRLSACRIPETDAPAWPAVTATLDALGETVRSMGARHVMVVHPDQYQMEPALAREVMETFDLDPARYDLELPLRYVHSYAVSRKIVAVQVAAAFRAHDPEGSYYLLRDTHYNDLGNRIAAEAIAMAVEPMIAGANARIRR